MGGWVYEITSAGFCVRVQTSGRAAGEALASVRVEWRTPPGPPLFHAHTHPHSPTHTRTRTHTPVEKMCAQAIAASLGGAMSATGGGGYGDDGGDDNDAMEEAAVYEQIRQQVGFQISPEIWRQVGFHIRSKIRWLLGFQIR